MLLSFYSPTQSVLSISIFINVKWQVCSEILLQYLTVIMIELLIVPYNLIFLAREISIDLIS